MIRETPLLVSALMLLAAALVAAALIERRAPSPLPSPLQIIPVQRPPSDIVDTWSATEPATWVRLGDYERDWR